MNLLQDIANNPLFLIPLVIWSLSWKGIALWKSGRNNQLPWFIVILVLNTMGLIEILYILWFQKKKPKKTS